VKILKLKKRKTKKIYAAILYPSLMRR